MNDDHPVIAGLRLGWQPLAPPPHSGNSPAIGDVAFGLWAPVSPDTTLDQITQDEFDRTDERMPYFATIWPSAEALVAEVLAGPPLDGQCVVDLGCGLGPCGLAAARWGAHVTFFDWEPRALEIVRASAAAQEFPTECDFVVGDWRDPPSLGPFDFVLGADILYERRNVPAVAAFLSRYLKPDAEAWITDPGRPQAERFPEVAQAAGLDLFESRNVPLAPNVQITLWRLRRPR